MDHQRGVIVRAVCDRTLADVVNARILPEHFVDTEYRNIFRFLLEHWRDYAGSPPDERVLLAAYPNFEIDSDEFDQPLDYYIKGLKLRMESVIMVEGMRRAADLLGDEEITEEERYSRMKETLRTTLVKATSETSSTRDLNVIPHAGPYSDMLEMRRSEISYLRGISTGLTKLDYVTGGLQAEQLITILGQPKSFKSSLALYLAWQAHIQGRIPLFVGFEMSNDEQMDRLASLMSGVGLSKILNGSYSKGESTLIRRTLTMRKDMQPFLLSADVEHTTTLTGLQAKINEYQPNVVFVDGVYMMDPEDDRLEPGSAMALTKITRSLKRMAQKMRLPIVITTQASVHRSKGGIGLQSVMYSTSFLQDSDLVLAAERVNPGGIDPDPKDPAVLLFKVLLSRSGPRDDVRLEWDWTKGRVLDLDATAGAFDES